MTTNEEHRIEALVNLDILDTPEEHEFDELVRLASEICDTPISLVSLVDRERQWFKASVGLPVKETHRNVSFCSHAIQNPELFVVENALRDARFCDNALVTGDPRIRFYAGIPLHAPNGFAVGTLCVIDTVPRVLTESQKNALTILGRQVKARMELRAKHKALESSIARNEELYTALRSRNSLFLAFMNNGPFVSYIKDADGRMVFYNNQLAHNFGVTPDAWLGKSDQEIWPAEVAESFRRNDLAIFQGGVPVEVDEVSPGPNNNVTHWKSYKFPFKSESGDVMLAGMSLDVTEQLRRKAELDKILQEKLELAKSLQTSTILFQTFVNNNPNVCFFKSAEGKYLFYNAKFAELFGISEEAWVGKTDHDVLPKELADSVRNLDLAILEQDDVYEICREIRNAKGETVWHKSFKFPISTADGGRILAEVAIDVSEEIRKELALSEANAQLAQLATTDALTGLSNRRIFEEQIAITFSAARRNDRPLSLIVLDIDNFKLRNDTFGHAAGDEALRLLGKVLLGCVRTGEPAARIGGEEFAIVLSDMDSNVAKVVASRIRTMLQAVEFHAQPLTVSMGIAAVTKGTASWEQLLSQADEAMYLAKRTGKDRWVSYEDREQSAVSVAVAIG